MKKNKELVKLINYLKRNINKRYNSESVGKQFIKVDKKIWLRQLHFIIHRLRILSNFNPTDLERDFYFYLSWYFAIECKECEKYITGINKPEDLGINWIKQTRDLDYKYKKKTFLEWLNIWGS